MAKKIHYILTHNSVKNYVSFTTMGPQEHFLEYMMHQYNNRLD